MKIIWSSPSLRVHWEWPTFAPSKLSPRYGYCISQIIQYLPFRSKVVPGVLGQIPIKTNHAHEEYYVLTHTHPHTHNPHTHTPFTHSHSTYTLTDEHGPPPPTLHGGSPLTEWLPMVIRCSPGGVSREDSPAPATTHLPRCYHVRVPALPHTSICSQVTQETPSLHRVPHWHSGGESSTWNMFYRIHLAKIKCFKL